MEPSQQDQAHNSSHENPTSVQDPDFFIFIRKEEWLPKPSSSFSINSLGQDVIQVTQAEPDVSLEVFYALYNTLWPQVEKQADLSLKEAWTRFIGGSVSKGGLCPPERLITEKRIAEIKRSLSEPEGEVQVFQDLDEVVNSIYNLKEKVNNHWGKILRKEEIIESLRLLQEFYQKYRSKIKWLVQAILEKEKKNVSYSTEYKALEDLLEPQAVMMGDIFHHHWAYRIPKCAAQKLLPLEVSDCNLQSNPDDPSKHHVISLPENSEKPLVFFKANGNPPIQPEKEFVLSSLYRHLQIPVKETGLILLTEVFEANPDNFYAVQASEAVLGGSSVKACQDPETIFDHDAYASQVFGAFLTNPSNGSFKNLQYSSIHKTLMSIDNGSAFKSEITGDDDKKTANVKSVLYLLSQIDLPIPESIQTFFTTLDPDLLTLLWLQDLSGKNQEYQLLFRKLSFQKTRCIYQNLLPESETPCLADCLKEVVNVDSQIQNERFYPQILISKNQLTRLLERLQMIEKILLKNRSASIQGLFEEISPILGKYYRKLRFEFDDPEEAFGALCGNKKNEVDVDYSFLSSLLDPEELTSDLVNDSTEPDDESLPPETFTKEYKSQLVSKETLPLDNFIQRHSQRKKRNSMNLKLVLKELKFLFREELTSSEEIRDIIDFHHSVSKMTGSDSSLGREVAIYLSNLSHPELKWLLELERCFLRPDDPEALNCFYHRTVVGAFMKKRTFVFNDSADKELFDSQGNILKNPALTGRSRVTCHSSWDPRFYLKQYPEWPGYEFASMMFMRLMGVTNLPYQDLIIMNDYPVLLTQRVSGHPILRVWNYSGKVLKNLDPFHTTLLIISAMFLNPEDGKEDNFILSEDGKYLIPIDNDHCFLPSFFQKEGNFWNAFTVNTALQAKTILFCLDEMYLSIPSAVKKHILSLDFDTLLTKWMTEVDKLENRFNNLVDQGQRKKFLEGGTVMRIPFYKQFIQSMYWKAHKVQDILKKGSGTTPFDLLRAVEPFAARCYENSFKQGHDLQSRFKAATEKLYTKSEVNGSRVSILNTRSMMEIINVSAEELQNDAMFQKMGPVDALELLKQLIQERNEKVQREQELLYELDEKSEDKRWISLFGNPSSEAALKAFFANAKEGLILRGCKLITSSKLTELFALAPDQGNKIRFLSLPESPLLTYKEIRLLAEGCPNIEYLNVSGCPKVKQIYTAEAEWPLLTRLEATDCPKLEKFVSYSPLKILRIGTSRKIEIFVDKSSIEILAISNKKNQVDFSFKTKEGLKIQAPDQTISNENFVPEVLKRKEGLASVFRDLKIRFGEYSILSEKDLAIFMTVLDLSKSNLTTQDLQIISALKFINLQRLELSGNKIIEKESFQYLIQGDWPKLDYLGLSLNEFTDDGLEALFFANWPVLETLDLSYTGVSNKGLLNFIVNINWPSLERIISEKYTEYFIKSLLQKNWQRYVNLNLSQEAITYDEIEVIVKKCHRPQLKHLNLNWTGISDEALEILVQADWPLLETLELRGTKATAKSLVQFLVNAKWPNLQKVGINEYKERFIQSLLQKNWSQTTMLDLQGSKVTEDEIEVFVQKCHWPQLNRIYLYSNSEINDRGFQLLAQGNWPSLETLQIESTKITAVGIEAIAKTSNWPKLKLLYLTYSEMDDEGFRALAQANWPELRSLHLQATNMTTAGVEAIVKTANFPQLKLINLENNYEINDEGFEILAQGNWPLLECLLLGHTKITAVGLEAIVNQAKWPELKELSLRESSEINDEGLEILSRGNWPKLESLFFNFEHATTRALSNFLLNANWPAFKKLLIHKYWDRTNGILANNFLKKDLSQVKRLELNNFQVKKADIEKIINQYKCPNLQYLNLSDNNISLEGIEILAFGECPLLQELHLENTKITSREIETLVNQSKWPLLEFLNISNNEIFDEGLEILASGNWPCLKNLNLSNTKITLKRVDVNENLARISHLNLSKNEIFDEGLLALVLTDKEWSWSFLEELNLKNTRITPKGVEILVNKIHLPNLKKLDISENSIFDEGLEILASGNWPLFEHLVYCKTKITQKGQVALLENSQWPNLNRLEHSLHESFYNKDQGIWPSPEVVVPVFLTNKKQSPFIAVLDPIHEIDFSIDNNEKSMILSRETFSAVNNIDKLFNTALKFRSPNLFEPQFNHGDPKPKSHQFIIWPSSLRELKFEKNSFSYVGNLENFYPGKCSSLEIVDLKEACITSFYLELLITRSSWPNLRILNIPGNEITNEGLEILVSADWQFLEGLDLRKTGITDESFEILATKSYWPKLQGLDLSYNSKFSQDGLESLASRRWPSVKRLGLIDTRILLAGATDLLEKQYWVKLEQIHLKMNKGSGQILTHKKWPNLRVFY